MKKCLINAGSDCSRDTCTDHNNVTCCTHCKDDCENRCTAALPFEKFHCGAKKVETVYISGAVTGNPSHVYEFQEAAVFLVENGFKPVNPVEIMEPVADLLSYKTVLNADLEILEGCDGVLFLPGWDESRGCRKEHEKATRTGKALFYMLGWGEPDEQKKAEDLRKHKEAVKKWTYTES